MMNLMEWIYRLMQKMHFLLSRMIPMEMEQLRHLAETIWTPADRGDKYIKN